jgi:hypothetical protein
VAVGAKPLLCYNSSQNNGAALVKGHERALGAPHVLCGTAGVDETSVRWYDGFRDDFEAYTVVRRADGSMLDFRKYAGLVPGQALPSDKERAIREQRNAITSLDTHWESIQPGTTFEDVFDQYIAMRLSPGSRE